MKYQFRFTAVFLAVAVFFTISASDLSAQLTAAAEMRPFDLTDKAYSTNGVDASLIVNRKNGADGLSVFDTPAERRYRGVRIIETHPAYDMNGEILFWYSYGSVEKEGFTPDKPGEKAQATAERSPVYFFPSAFGGKQDRQAPLIPVNRDYWTNNPLGLGIPVLVEYTGRIESEEGQRYLTELETRNGKSLDGTPIIKTLVELNHLTSMNIVRQTLRVNAFPFLPEYVTAKAFANPGDGAITRDAFLEFVRQPDGNPLPAELEFLNNFECLRRSGAMCQTQ